MAFFHSTPQGSPVKWFTVGMHLYQVSFYPFLHYPRACAVFSFFARLKNHQVLLYDDQSWTQLKFLNCVLITSISGCSSASHVALTWLVQSLLGSSGFFSFLWATLPTITSEERSWLGFFFLVREMLSRLWEKRRGLKKPKSKSIAQVYDKKKLGK